MLLAVVMLTLIIHCSFQALNVVVKYHKLFA